MDPSGGDWGLRRAGLFHLEGTARVNITGCTFYRTDANAVMIAGFNRNASVVDSEFAYTGMSAVVTFGRTLQDDGSNGEQPFGTLIAYNKVHEMGAYQLQSSAWFTSRATLTRAEGLVVFNIPRAAINFNDGFGGGNNVTGASIFNTCRSSSDHGPMCVVRRSARAALCLPPPALSHCRFPPPPHYACTLRLPQECQCADSAEPPPPPWICSFSQRTCPSLCIVLLLQSWDRMPFFTNIRSGGQEYTYAPALTDTAHSMIIANYGASQAFDVSPWGSARQLRALPSPHAPHTHAPSHSTLRLCVER